MQKICSVFLMTAITCMFSCVHYIQCDQSCMPQEKEVVRGMKTNKKTHTQDPILGTIKAHDEVALGYACYLPVKPQASLILYHGSGVNGLAGYTYMAEQLALQYNIATYLFDIRGHGRSGGQRGHVSFPDDIWHDVRTAMEYVQTCYPNVPIFLAGHSGGASMLLNYQLWQGKKVPQGYVFIAPAFGPKAGVNRTRVATDAKRRPFVEINQWVLLVHYLSCGYIGGDWHAVTFHYPDHLITERGFITHYTANMVSALAPHDVLCSLRQIEVPLCICIADQDELFDPVKTDHFLEPIMQNNKHITNVHLPDAHHLTILGCVHDEVGVRLTCSKQA